MDLQSLRDFSNDDSSSELDPNIEIVSIVSGSIKYHLVGDLLIDRIE